MRGNDIRRTFLEFFRLPFDALHLFARLAFSFSSLFFFLAFLFFCLFSLSLLFLGRLTARFGFAIQFRARDLIALLLFPLEFGTRRRDLGLLFSA